MDARAERFVDVSAALTGFCRVTLAGTGVTADYIATLDAVLPSGLLDKLLERWCSVGRAGVLGDATLGPVARNIILLWYRGAWTPLPADWREANGASALDVDRVISAHAYRAGLQWAAAGAHAAGAAPQGFAAWSLPPATSTP